MATSETLYFFVTVGLAPACSLASRDPKHTRRHRSLFFTLCRLGGRSLPSRVLCCSYGLLDAADLGEAAQLLAIAFVAGDSSGEGEDEVSQGLVDQIPERLHSSVPFRCPARMASTMAKPVTPVMSLMTWWFCRFATSPCGTICMRYPNSLGNAIKQRWTRENAIRNVNIRSDGDAVRMRIITAPEEKDYFLRTARNKNVWDLAMLIRNQGMRPEEVVSLRKEDVDLERGQSSATAPSESFSGMCTRLRNTSGKQ